LRDVSSCGKSKGDEAMPGCDEYRDPNQGFSLNRSGTWTGVIKKLWQWQTLLLLIRKLINHYKK
jgi:hypothetical protein